MALAINVIDRHGPSSKVRPQLQLTKTKIMLHYQFILQQKAYYLPFITSKTKRFSFKSGCVVRLVKHLKEDWFIVLQ